jgi:Mrp family chromosome partitioning ATPase
MSVNKLSTPELTILSRPTVQVPDVAERREVAPVRVDVGAIARHEPSFVQLYYAIEARRTSTMPLVVQFISPSTGTGASTVASGYARVAADDSAQPVLYIDCTGRREQAARPGEPPTLLEALRRGRPLGEASVPAGDASNLLWARLSPGRRPLLNVGGERLQALLDGLRTQHSVIVLDCDSTSNPESAALARYCDGSVLVVAAGRTRQVEIDTAKTLIERRGGQPVGVVLNREKAVLPRWLERR